jgi:hypothetical protein
MKGVIADVNDTGEKLIAGVVDTGNKTQGFEYLREFS